MLVAALIGLAPDPTVDPGEEFSTYDINGNGFISVAELHTVLAATGDQPAVGEASDMISEWDVGGDGHVSKDEFSAMVRLEKDEEL